jgi:ATP-binding cassette, subfamily B, bacterial
MSNGRQQGDFILMRRLLLQTRDYWPHLSLILLLNLLSTPLSLLTPVPLKIAVDHVIDHKPLPDFVVALLPVTIVESSVGILCLAVVLLLLITLLQNLEGYGSWLLQLYTGEKLVLGFRARLFGHMQRLSLFYHDMRGVSDSLYRVQFDVSAMQYLPIHGIVPLVTSSLTLGAMIWVTAVIDWQLAIIPIVVIPLLVLFSELYRRRARNAWAEVKNRESGAMSVVQEVLGAVRVVKAFGQERHEEGRFYCSSYDSLRTHLRAVFMEAKFGILVAMTISGGAAAALLVGVRDVQAGVLSLGDLLVVIAYLTQLCRLLENLTRNIGALQASFASAERVLTVLDEHPDVAETKAPRPLRCVAGAIAFSNVQFAYGSDPPVLRDISFHVAPGMRVAISGPTGAGKTTLVSLLPRFHDPTAGQVLIDGIDLREYRLADLRSQFAIVLQEPVLFSTTVAQNIAYGRPEGAEEEIVAAAKAANAHDFIVRLPQGYGTLVGERGMRLSGGERQRISIARAFFRNAPILILDEPTSSVDATSEAMIMEAIARLMQRRTTFVVAHRPAALQNCDLHLHLEHGRLVDADALPAEKLLG